jgi:hypothetical protein
LLRMRAFSLGQTALSGKTYWQAGFSL